MKLVKILSAFAVVAAGGMVLAGCESPAGVGNGNEAASTETVGLVPENADSSALKADYSPEWKKVNVKFDVRNGGAGLMQSGGIVSTQDDSYLVYDRGASSRDFTITITVPASDEYLNIRWQGADWVLGDTYVKAKMKLKSSAIIENDTITVDYNGQGKAATKNLYDVQVQFEDDSWVNPHKCELAPEWKDAKKRAVRN